MTTVPLGKFDPHKAQNHEDIEKQFAVVAVQHAKIYWKILGKVEPKGIRLTKIDDDIYEDFRTTFPELFEDGARRIVQVDEDEMKSQDNKVRWQNFLQKYQQKVADYNFGTLMRANSKGEYSEENTIFVLRLQFLAIEISRNRLGLNDEAHEKAKADEQSS